MSHFLISTKQRANERNNQQKTATESYDLFYVLCVCVCVRDTYLLEMIVLQTKLTNAKLKKKE